MRDSTLKPHARFNYRFLKGDKTTPLTPSRHAAASRLQPIPEAKLADAVLKARNALLAAQQPAGHWCFELEADCTIPAEYILMMHFLGEIDRSLEARIATYLRAHQENHGGWPLYPGGGFDLSCSVKAYYALKLGGDDPDAPHMARARAAILAHGGAARCNVFTRITLALFGQIPWHGVPLVPVEIMLLPHWFPFHLSKVSYWSRTVMVPLSVLCSLKARARNPRHVNIRELFAVAPETEPYRFPARSLLNRALTAGDRLAKFLEPGPDTRLRRWAMARAERWIVERLNGEDGLGAIFPAMVNALEALTLLGYPPHHEWRATAKRALEKLLVVDDNSAYCQPCTSPVWDTALACLALHETSGRTATAPLNRALDWLAARQLLDEPGDWRQRNPRLPGGGWAFQYANDYYPDTDDTAVVAWAMHQIAASRYEAAIARAATWLHGMQSRNGGFAAFDVDNTHYYLNEIPFADHGALLDPPTSDVTARCVTFLSLLGQPQHRRTLRRALGFLRREQEKNGGWFGRWGTNYIYGTWSVLTALSAAGIPPGNPAVQRAAAWLRQMQHIDGGWGESNDTYFDSKHAGGGEESTPFQTAWAMLGLMAAGEAADSSALRRGAAFLLRTQQAGGLWQHRAFTCPGFPRVFYLKYHGYNKYFPLWALARYQNLTKG
jgi:squalene-hopene/tetraprenyl-beta-curcumene cyclase